MKGKHADEGGREPQKTPLTMKVKPGEHQCRLHHDATKASEKRVSANPQEEQTMSLPPLGFHLAGPWAKHVHGETMSRSMRKFSQGLGEEGTIKMKFHHFPKCWQY